MVGTSKIKLTSHMSALPGHDAHNASDDDDDGGGVVVIVIMMFMMFISFLTISFHFF